MSEGSPYVGKYVCYNAVDGGMCWGRIKAEVKVNTMDGEKSAFILEGRIIGYLRAKTGITLKNVSLGSLLPTRTVQYSPSTGQSSNELEIEVVRIKGDTLIRLDVLNLEKDVIDIDLFLSKVSDDSLFLALLDGKGFENRALDLGLSEIDKEFLTKELKKRMEQKDEQ